MLNIIYKEGNNNNNKSYIIFPDLDLGSDNCISERTNNESLELRKLKLLVTGFISKSYVNSYKSFDGKIKQILEIFIKNTGESYGTSQCTSYFGQNRGTV